MSRFKLVAIVSGILISLLLTLILKLIIGDAALWILPILAGLISVFLANETDILGVVITSIIAGLISIIWVGPLFVIFALLGGCVASILNGYINHDSPNGLGRRNITPNSRVSSIENWITHPRTNKLIPIIIIIILAILLIWGIGLPVSDNHEPVKNITNNTTTNSQDQLLKNNIKKAVVYYFKDFNSLFNQTGINSGYILDTITIVNIKKVSDSQVNVTVNLIRISDTGEKFNSTWSGPFYSYNGVWVENGDFVQINSTVQPS